jgi:hypothetical protein
MLQLSWNLLKPLQTRRKSKKGAKKSGKTTSPKCDFELGYDRMTIPGTRSR